MAIGEFTRRLAAIVAADVAGFSRLVAADEEGTLSAMRSNRLDLIDPKIAEYGGRIANTAGDSLLIEFPSVVEALRCAIDIQHGMAERNIDIPEDKQIKFRVGINVGDVIDQDGDLLGDGVNIAARLEGLAEPGGIFISRPARDQVRDRLEVMLEDMGEVEVKNIARPVRVFRVLRDADDVLAAQRKTKKRVTLRYAVVGVAAMVFLALTGFATWQWPWFQEEEILASPLSAETSIAVLPFANLSSDPKQDYFSDGITNDIITDISKFHELFVIASNSVFAYKGKAVSARRVAEELAVRYVMEGSVQRHGAKVRINAQLIDGKTGQHLWAERFNESAADIFSLQDEITRRIVRTLAVKLTEIEEKQAFAKPTGDLKAYDYVLRARALAERSLPDENFKARELFRRAIERDPAYASAYAGLGLTYFEPVLWGWTESPQKAMKQAHDLAQKALSLDASNVEARRLLVQVYNLRRQYQLAIIEAERVIAVNPNDAQSYAIQGVALVWAGQVDGAILSLETALRFDPNMEPKLSWNLGLAYYLKSRFNDSIAVMEKNIGRRLDNAFDYMLLAAGYAQMNRPDEAAIAAASVLRLSPFFQIKDFGPQFRDPADAARVAVGLRKAGLK